MVSAVRASLLAAHAALALASARVSATSAECSALTENTLTSDGCPSDCLTYPCVLYSPSQDDGCTDWGASGPCYADDNFTVPGASSACNMTYQCLDSLVTSSKKQWLLGLAPNKQVDTVTMAPVTEIVSLEYSSATQSV